MGPTTLLMCTTSKIAIHQLQIHINWTQSANHTPTSHAQKIALQKVVQTQRTQRLKLTSIPALNLTANLMVRTLDLNLDQNFMVAKIRREMLIAEWVASGTPLRLAEDLRHGKRQKQKWIC
jgi:hypothetical protein